MKVGDRLAVQIEGMDVGEAVIEDIEDGHATIVIPATRLVVQVRQSLDLSATREPEVDRILAGTVEDNTSQSAAAEEHNAPAEQPAPAPAPVQSMGGADVGEGIHNQNLDSSAID